MFRCSGEAILSVASVASRFQRLCTIFFRTPAPSFARTRVLRFGFFELLLSLFFNKLVFLFVRTAAGLAANPADGGTGEYDDRRMNASIPLLRSFRCVLSV